MRIIKIKFVGIDSWNRPIYKDVNSRTYFGATNALFGYDEEDLAQQYINEHIEELTYFGQHFDCEPMGISITDFKEQTKLEIVKE